MPNDLSKVYGDEILAEQFADIDRQLYETGGANFDLMLYSERFISKNAEAAKQSWGKHLVMLDRLVTEGTLSISSMYDHYFYWLAGSLASSRKGGHSGPRVPTGRKLALRTPWKAWECLGVTMKHADCLIRSSRETLSLPLDERISYMMAFAKNKLNI